MQCLTPTLGTTTISKSNSIRSVIRYDAAVFSGIAAASPLRMKVAFCFHTTFFPNIQL